MSAPGLLVFAALDIRTDHQTMRVLLISTSFPRDLSDWRGLFIRHLSDALARADDVELSVWAPPGGLSASAVMVASPREAAWLSRLMEAGGISHLMRGGGLPALFSPLRLLQMLRSVYRRLDAVDLYHINWLQCALPLPANGKPALVTVLGNDLKLLRLPLMRALLKRVMRRRPVVICPNAEWMLAPLQSAFGDVAEIVPISFGIDPCWYAIRREPIAGQAKRWIAVTRLTRDKLGPLLDWSEPLFQAGVRELHLFGPMQEDIEVPDWVHYHGSVTPAQLAGEWFPNACGLVSLSRHAEGRPQVMLEAMAAGLPIIASRMPAHASLVDDDVTGRLCDSREEYAAAMEHIEDAATNARYGRPHVAGCWPKSALGTTARIATSASTAACGMCSMAEAIVVLGAGGFIGQHLTRALSAQGIPVIAVERRPLQVREGRTDIVFADLSEPETIVPLLRRSRAVVHLASASTPGSSAGRPLLELQQNLQPTLTLLHAMQEMPELPLLYLSSAGTLYQGSPDEASTENAPIRPKSYHGAGKAAAEHFIHAWCSQNGSAATVLRPSNVYGPGQAERKGFGIIPAGFGAILRQTPMTVWGDGSTVRDYLYIEDLIRLCVTLLTRPMAPGMKVLNASSGAGISLNELFEQMQVVTGKAHCAPMISAGLSISIAPSLTPALRATHTTGPPAPI